MESNVKLLHLLNGEDILAEVTSVGNDTTMITNPARIVMMPPQRPGESVGVGMAPWLQFSDSKSVELKNDHIMYQVNPIKEMLNNYQQMFAKIITPKTSILMP